MLESRLLLATQPPICLDPSTDVVCFTNRLQYNQRKFHTPAIRRTLRRRSHARRARMHMSSVGVAPRGLQLHDFITQRAKTEPIERKRDVGPLSHSLLTRRFISIVVACIQFSNCWKKAKVDHQLEDTPETVSLLHVALFLCFQSFSPLFSIILTLTPSHPSPSLPFSLSLSLPFPPSLTSLSLSLLVLIFQIFASILQLAKPVAPPPLLEQPRHPRRSSALSQPKPHPQSAPRPPAAAQ